MRILIIQDNETDISILKKMILRGSKNRKVSVVSSFEEGIEFIKRDEIDILLFEIEKMKKCGIKYIDDLKEHGMPFTIAFIDENMLALRDKYYGYGVNFILTKLEYFELVHIINNFEENTYKKYLKSSSTECEKHSRMRYNDIELCLESHEVWEDGENIKLQSKEFKLLKYLIEKQGVVLERESIIQDVWNEKYLESNDRVVDNCVYRIKKKIKTIGNDIETVSGKGYKLRKNKIYN